MGTKGIVFTTIGVIVGLWLLTAAIWGFGVATAGIFGRGEQIKQVNSAENRTFQYNHFFDLDATVKTQTSQFRQAAAAAKQYDTTHKGDSSYAVTTESGRLNSVAQGLQALCTQNLNQYNADAEKVVTGALFRDNNLPERLPDGPATNCTDGGQ